MGRPPCCDKSNVKRGLWTAEEDAKILAYVSAYGTGNWTLVPKKAGLNRCGKSCRLRWTNYLRPDLKHESFTPQEEQLIIDFHKAIGSRWSMIARQLPGRTDNDVKNYWNTKLRKKLAKMGIDPVTHKPIPQVMSEYGNISRLPNSTSLVGPTARPVPGSPSSSVLPGSVPGIDRLMRNHNPSLDPNLAAESLYPGISAAAWNQLLCQYQVDIDRKSVQSQHFLNEVTSSSSSSSSTLTTQFLDSSKQGYFRPSQAHEAPSPPFTLPDLLPDNPPLLDGFLQRQRLSFQPEVFSPATEPSSPTISRAHRVESTLGSGSNANRAIRASDVSDPLYGAASGDLQNRWFEASSSPGNSFVDSILHRDSQIQQQFPELLDGLLDY